MINNLSISSPYLTTSSHSPPYINNNGQSAGSMRYNISAQQVEVFDGFNWIVVSQNVSIGLTWTADEAIRWAEQKMKEEKDLKQRMEQHPGLKDAWEKFQLIDLLTKEENGL